MREGVEVEVMDAPILIDARTKRGVGVVGVGVEVEDLAVQHALGEPVVPVHAVDDIVDILGLLVPHNRDGATGHQAEQKQGVLAHQVGRVDAIGQGRRPTTEEPLDERLLASPNREIDLVGAKLGALQKRDVDVLSTVLFVAHVVQLGILLEGRLEQRFPRLNLTSKRFPVLGLLLLELDDVLMCVQPRLNCAEFLGQRLETVKAGFQVATFGSQGADALLGSLCADGVRVGLRFRPHRGCLVEFHHELIVLGLVELVAELGRSPRQLAQRAAVEPQLDAL